MSNIKQNVDFDNLSDEQLDALLDSTTPRPSQPSNSPIFQPLNSPTVQPLQLSGSPTFQSGSPTFQSGSPTFQSDSTTFQSGSPTVHFSHTPVTLHPNRSTTNSSEFKLASEVQQLRYENEQLKNKIQTASAPKLTPAQIQAEIADLNQNLAAYRNKRASEAYYAQRSLQRERSGYIDPFFRTQTVAFVNTCPTGDARCSQTNSRSSFSSIHVMGTGRSNVGLGLIGFYGSAR